MKTEGFSSLYTTDYNLTDLFAMRQHWKAKRSFTMHAPRRTAALLYFCGCGGRYCVKGKTFTVPKGAVVYIPQGSVYNTDFLEREGEGPDTVLVEFSLADPKGNHFEVEREITVLPSVDPGTEQLFFETVEEQALAAYCPTALKSSVYRLVNRLARAERHRAAPHPRFRAIAAGIAYLETDPKQEKSMREVAEMCFVSDAYFRRLFKEYAGVTPMEYRLRARMEYAKQLLGSGGMTAAEVAAELGFADPAYFNRVFKKCCGIAPGTYRKKLQEP